MTKIIKLKTGSPFEDQASYSRLVVVDNWIYVSNTAGRNPQTKLIPGDILEQTHQVFANIETALAAVDASLADVVCSRVFIQDPKDVPAVMGLIGGMQDLGLVDRLENASGPERGIAPEPRRTA